MLGDIENFEDVLLESPIIFVIWDSDEIGKTKYISKNINRFGYNADDFNSGKINFFDIIHPEDKKEIQRESKIYRKHKLKKYNQQYRIITKDKQIMWVNDFTIKTKPNSNLPYCCKGILTDISQQKEAEKGMKNSKEALTSVIEQIPTSIQIFSLAGILIYTNKASQKLWGTDFSSSIGRYNILEDEQYKKLGVMGLIERAFTGTTLSIPSIKFVPKKSNLSGNKLIILSHFVPIKINNKKIINIALIHENLEEKLRLEEQILKTQKTESISTLAGGIAHDFNNILTAILGNLSIAKMDLEEGNVEIYDLIIDAEKASLRAQKLTNQLLSFSKGGSPIKKTVSVGEIIKETTKFALRGSKIKCDFEFDKEIWPVDVDEGQISQVINNLVINAIQAMPKGGILTVKVKNIMKRLHPEISTEFKKSVMISVKDSGVGIPKEYLNSVFEPYFTTKEKGHGLGLAMCYSIVKNHGGFIDVESKVNFGTTFNIFLPASEKKILKHLKEKKKLSSGFGKKILVMDDDDEIRLLMKKMLTHLGYQFEFVKNGYDAFEVYKRNMRNNEPFDMVIMDLTIPGGLGAEDTVKLIQNVNPKVKTVISSGYSNHEIMVDPKKYGFKSILIKPFTIKNLDEILKII